MIVALFKLTYCFNMINLKKEFGKRVRQYRKAMGLSQMKFAEKADITFQTLSSIERGITFPSYPILIKIIETLNVPIVKLFCYDETVKVFARSKEISEIGLDVPQITKVFEKLKDRGLDFGKDVYTVEYAKNLLLKKLRGGTANC